MKKLFYLFLLFASTLVYSQFEREVVLNWEGSSDAKTSEVEVFKFPFFSNKELDVDIANRVLLYSEVFNTVNFVNPSSLITNVEYQSITESELYGLNKNLIPSSISANIKSVNARDKIISVFTFSPIIKDGVGYKKVIKINYSFGFDLLNKNTNSSFSVNAIQNSVLATGNWYRFYVEKSGVYRISKSFLQSLGLNTNVDPRTIKIYGNGGRMLPLQNQPTFSIDLEENAIQFIGENDGVFDDSDYILFYAEGVDTWNNESLTSVNLFADKSYYYVTSGAGNGKRIQDAVEPTNSPNLTFTNYDAVKIYEKDLVNVAKLGRRWFGEQFNVDNSQTFQISFSNLDTSVPLELKINLASKSPNPSSFSISANNQNLGTINFVGVPNGATFEAFENTLNTNFTSTNDNITFQIDYDNGGVPFSNGYLDFIRVKGKCNLEANGQQFFFFNDQQATNIGIGQYALSNANSIEQVWDVTDILNVERFVNTSGGNFAFKVNLGQERKYLVVDPSNYFAPLKESNSVVQNQNLKGTIFLNNSGAFEDVDYLIITPNFLRNQAENLANFHRQYSGLNVKVVTTESIYHEFGSGKQDVAAIRNFIRYVYLNGSSLSERVNYVNLFGDASYDYKNRVANNSNIVPIFHGFNPGTSEVNNTSNMSLVSTFMSDDFYGLMDDGEGRMLPAEPDGIDIAVGRMLVNNVQEANEMVNKVIEYHAEDSYGRWRNTYTIYSDDADTTGDAQLQVYINDIADVLVNEKPFVNVKKIHSDAYIQEVTAGGEKYPEAKNDFLNVIELGSLVINYFGHGNEEFLANERLFERLDAQTLNNRYRYPLFITITCDFTRFDDPNRLTGGEFMYWNTDGGAIALVATTREIFVNTGVTMNSYLTEFLYAYGSYDYPTIGEAVRLTKIQSGSNNRRVVSFIGDPAMYLAIPKPKVVLTEVNDIPVSQPLPIFQALSPMKIEGEIVDEGNALLANYIGDVAIQIFDKPINRSTLGNNGVTNGTGQLITMNFVTLGETIVRGNASVTDGKFEFNFVVPQDIRIPLGNGKISFYAKRNSPQLEDQTGYNLDIQVGGVNTSAGADTTPPSVQLFMNDESFVSGGITNCSPILIAKLQDENGINTASGIGHDIVAILDGDESNPYVLNDYYETALDDFTNGIVRFPFRDLEPGMHTILFKAWDVYNNLITMEIQFNAICSDEGLKIDKVLNYPNPFSTYTEFWFTHNSPFEALDVQVQIFTITGKVVKTINQQVVTDGFLCREVKWDGRDDFGDRIGKGVYVYKLTVKSARTGNQTEKHEKLVIL
ncbi:type IX secretion system sortase PorU [Flavobacterium okayamense]|uniref:Peptidase C25 n=1 Tax=Flavobacterium okayamense TaxID=2830782 RepID=A0ABN6HUW6_9FLAO|nr:type IX secretion system sortase PorU [Flavobacterium okayamense]BCY28244.1 peptidase C25 [Flavobacterium okayamense]